MDIDDTGSGDKHNYEDEFGPSIAITPGAFAREYRTHGFQIVPAGNKKSPLVAWKALQHRQLTDAEFNPWYATGGTYDNHQNMGMVCGECSGGVFIVDLDLYKSSAAATWWRAVVDRHMEPETVEQITGGGGIQKLFRAPAGWTPPTCKTPIGVDIRGQGGFAMLPPSLHESGKTYQWAPGCAPGEREVAEAEPWLCDAIDSLVLKFRHLDSPLKPGGLNGRNGGGTDQVHDAFGKTVDGRETLMRDLVWGAVVDWYRECPIKPSERESRDKASDKYDVYAAQVSPQKFHLYGVTKTEALEEEDRGPTEFWAKWSHAMAQWETRVRDEAGKPAPRNNNSRRETPDIGQSPDLDTAAILTSAQFLAGYTPPAYLVDGIIQRGYLYSLTARTGHGKTAVAMYIAQCIARGQAMHGCKVKAGTVLILAGENPDDVRARFIVLGKAYGFDPETIKIRWVAGVRHLPSFMATIRRGGRADRRPVAGYCRYGRGLFYGEGNQQQLRAGRICSAA